MLKLELVLELVDEELDCCVDELCVEDELTALLLVNDSVVVDVEMLIEELVEDVVCEVLPVFDVLEV